MCWRASPRPYLVDRHRIDVDEIKNRQLIAQRLLGPGAQGAVQFGRAALDPQLAGQTALGAQTALHAGLHRVPDPVQTGIDLGLAAPGLLVGAHDPGDAQATSAAMSPCRCRCALTRPRRATAMACCALNCPRPKSPAHCASRCRRTRECAQQGGPGLRAGLRPNRPSAPGGRRGRRSGPSGRRQHGQSPWPRPAPAVHRTRRAVHSVALAGGAGWVAGTGRS
jgi:hypothetical protein